MAISAVFDGTWRPNMENNVPNFHKILRTTFVQIELKEIQGSDRKVQWQLKVWYTHLAPVKVRQQ